MDRAIEADLVNRAKSGDHKAYEKLIKPLRPQIYRRSLKAVGDADQAEDIAQETMIRAYTKIASFRGESKYSTWVYTICQRCILMYFRSKSRKGASPIDDVLDTEIDRGLRKIGSAMPTQEEFAIFSQKADSIDAAMQRLDQKYYEVIDLWLSGNTLHQIGHLTNLTVPAAKTRIHRARKQIRGLLQAA